MIVFLLLCSFAYGEQAYAVALNNLDTGITFSSVQLIEVDALPAAQDVSGYTAQLMDFSGNILHSSSFSPLSQGPFTLSLPYAAGGQKIVVKDLLYTELFTISVAHFSQLCGNGICNEQESYETCLDDCVSGGADDYCDGKADGACDPDCSAAADPDCVASPAAEPVADTAVEPATVPILRRPAKVSVPQKESHIGFFLSIAFIFIVFLAIFALLVHTFHKAKKAFLPRDYLIQHLAEGYHASQIIQALLRHGYNRDEVYHAYQALQHDLSVIQDYLRRNMQQGYPIQQLFQALAKSGYTQEEIHIASQSLSGKLYK